MKTMLALLVLTTSLYAAEVPRTAVIEWSNITRRAIVPAGPNGVFGAENFGNKFPGEAAVYMSIVHAAIYDAAVAIGGGYEPYAAEITVPEDVSAEAAISTAAHHTLLGLQPALGLNAEQQAIVQREYDETLARIANGAAKANGIALGEQVAEAILGSRQGDGRDRNPQLSDLSPPAPGPGVWRPGSSPAVGLRMPGMRPLVLRSGSQFRPDGPNALTSADYASDVAEVMRLGRAEGSARTASQTTSALFWTDHDARQWNDALVRLAVERNLDGVRTARMLAMAHAAGGDAMIACFDAKYTYWFWRPYQAIPQADQDGNDATVGDSAWKPLRPTPNFPEYPSAHACHTTATVEALDAFFGTDRIPLRLDSRITGTTRDYTRLHEAIIDVDWARVLAGFHFRNSDQEGSNLGRRVARYVVANRFRPISTAVRSHKETIRGTGTAAIAGAFADSCRDFAAHSNKDISHVEIHYEDGRVVKDESITSPDHAIDGDAGDEIAYAIVKSGTTTEQFVCVQSTSAPAAVLEIRTPDDCYPFFAGGLMCQQSNARTTWTRTSDVPETGDAAGILHWGCGDLSHPSLCSFTFLFRGIGSSDPDGDITSWSLDFGDGTSMSGSWITAPPVEIAHDFAFDVCASGVCTIVLTVTDAAGQSHADVLRMAFVDQTPD